MLAYHAVGAPPPGADKNNLFVHPDRFAEQMEYLAARRTVVPLEELLMGRATKKPAVAITFDDGYRHLLLAAVPVLESYGFESTVFVPTKWIGGANVWDPPSECDLAIMSEAELLEADGRGLRVESHGHAHIDMRVASRDEVERDLTSSRRILRDVMGRESRFLAWPYRDGSPEAREVAENAGFQAAFSIDQPHVGTFSCERVQITPRDGKKLFALKTSGHYMKLRHNPVLDRIYQSAKGTVRR